MERAGRRFALRVVTEADQDLRLVPYAIDLDFDKLLGKERCTGRFDRHSVLVKRADSRTGDLEDVAFNLSDDFLTGNRGKVNWLIEDTRQSQYVIFYDTDELGPFPPPAYIGLVGNGDCLRYNDGELHPLHVGMHANAVAVDWDGDGLTDIITPQIYSHTLGSPWFCVRFFRNEATNESPLFGEGIPLRARTDGGYEFLKAGTCIEVVDWNADGLDDVLVLPYGSSKEVLLYLNTGERDGMGLPVLEPGPAVPVAEKNHYGMSVVDWFGDGRNHLLMGYLTEYEIDRDEPLWFEATEEEKEGAQWPRWYYKSYMDFYENVSAPGKPLKFKAPVTLKSADGQPISYCATPSFEFVDWDGDGKSDLLVQDHSELLDKGCVGIRFYKNVGTTSSPRFEDRGRVGPFADRSSLWLQKANTSAFKGFLVNHGGASGKIRYYRFEGRDVSGSPIYADQGFLMQRNAYVSSHSGFAQGHVCDWDGDGDWDLVTGCETGFVSRSENIGDQKRPVFTEPELFQKDGAPIELLNGPFDDPGSFMEGPLGQTAPMYLDWDGDGIPDLVVTIGTRLYFFKNTGTAGDPVFLEPEEIMADGGERVAKHRNKPALVDWDGDGLMDIIGHDPEGRGLYLFRRYRDEQTGKLRLKKGEPLMHTDGTPVSPSTWHRYTKYFNVGDWRGKGVFDIFLSTCDLILYLQNDGTNERPKFRRPVRLEVDGEPISIGHHVSTPFPVDWDRSGRMDLFVSGESGLFHLFRRSYLDGAHRAIRHTAGPWALEAETEQDSRTAPGGN